MQDVIVNLSVNNKFQKSFNKHPKTYYLKDGTEFELFIQNLKQNTVMASIKFGTTNILNLVLRPGESIFVDRGETDIRKFIFNTYSVDGKSKDVKEAIKFNGKIDISFTDNVPYVLKTTLSYESHDWWKFANSFDTNSDEPVSPFRITIPNVGPGFIGDNPTNPTQILYGNATVHNTNSPKPTLIETGTIERSDNQSDTEYEKSNDNFNQWPFKTISLKLLPESEKINTVDSINSIYCVQCGIKKRATWKFCPKCGSDFK